MTHAPDRERVREGALAETGRGILTDCIGNHPEPLHQLTSTISADRCGWRQWPPGR